MTLQQLDDVLTMWQGRLAAMAENLLELQASADFQSLTGEGGLSRAEVRGATEAKVAPSLRFIHQLFQDFGALQATVDQAAALRRELPAMFGGEAKAREIQRLLFSPSVAMTPVVEVPLADRALLSNGGAVPRCTPEAMIERMGRQFAEIRDAVDTAGRAWSEFGQAADRLELELVRLRAQRSMPTALLTPALDAVEQSLERARKEAGADPIGAVGMLSREVEPLLAKADARVLAAEKVRAQLRAAEAQIGELRRSQAEVAAALEQRNGGILATEGAGAGAGLTAGVSDETVEALAAWLRRLEGKGEEGAHEAVTVGLANWRAAAARCLAQNATLLQTAKAQMASRDELRGRLRALKAKARANVAGAVPERARELGAAAERLLWSERVDLGAATTAVADYERSLRGNGAGGKAQGGAVSS